MNAMGLGSEVERLVGLVDAQDAFDYDYAEILPRQLAAIDERFQDRVQKIKLLQNRAEAGGVSCVMFGPLYRVAKLVRERGYSGKDFHPDNSCFLSGGLKREQLPADYAEFIFGAFNLSGQRICKAYGMQELNTNAVRCKCNRYHMAPWVMLLPLDESGENPAPRPASGDFEGRAAFFDLSLDGRWGGVISGDKIRVSYDTCECGARSPSISEDIQRYADTAGGDKIACAGAIDAYVRGV